MADNKAAPADGRGGGVRHQKGAPLLPLKHAQHTGVFLKRFFGLVYKWK